jgi:hypothetical protein
MARLELDSEGHLLFDGEVHVVTPEAAAEAHARSPEFFGSIHAIGMLIKAVDNSEWQQMATQQLIRLLDAMHEEVFSGCCPQCKLVIDATFQAAAGGMAS